MAKKNSSTELAKRYASPLFELARDSKQIDKIAADLDFLANLAVENDELKRLNGSPLISSERKKSVWQDVANQAKMADITVKFITLLAGGNRLLLLPLVASAFRALVLAERNMVEARIVSAEPLSKKQSDQLKAILGEISGHEVVIKAEQDPSLLGGAVIHIGSKMIDRSIKGNLERLKLHLKHAVAA